ncbi:MAG: hypothetical protein JOZ69_13155 [Myxococcales bacterium]|nr:hypothetical protein [Myxococcales bacterium]
MRRRPDRAGRARRRLTGVVRLAAIIGVALLLVSGAARAEGTLVVLVRPVGHGLPAGEVLHRLRGELVADGFDVLVVDPPSPADPGSGSPGAGAALAVLGRASGADVVAALFVADDAGAIDVRLAATREARVMTRRIDARPTSPDQNPEVFARRAVDALRALLLEFAATRALPDAPASGPAAAPASPAPAPAASASPPPASAAAPPAAPATPAGTTRTATVPGAAPSSSSPSAAMPAQGSRWALEAGLGVLASLEGVGPAILPLARVRFAAGRLLRLRLTGAWLGTQPRIDTAAGSASVEQGIALLECLGQWGREDGVRPNVSLGAGAYYVAVTGSGDDARPGVHNTDLALALDGGLGVLLPIGPRIDLAVEAHALLALPGIAVRFVDQDAARIGRPSLLGAVSLAGWI